MAASKLFSPFTFGGKNPIQLKHRLVMVPLGRLRASLQGVPQEIAATYYQQRATPGGLQIAEATAVTPYGHGGSYTPGIYSKEQVEGWKRVTSAVHEKEGVIFLQLWHAGRASHAKTNPTNEPPVSSSAKHTPELDAAKIPVPEGRELIGPTRALRTDEIPALVQAYQQGALNAIEAGFDGVEIHSANGYLLEQFLYDEINDRTDEYGGSIENRARLIFEVLDAIVAKVDSSRVAIRLSPFSVAAGQKLTNPNEAVEYLLKKLATYNLAYIHVIEPRGIHAPGPLAPEGGITPLFRKLYPGVIITASGYDVESAKKVVEDGDADLVGIGRAFIANPDLVERFRVGAPLNDLKVESLYNGGANHPGGAEGYTDYPFLDSAAQ